MKKICIISPGLLPVPAIEGGAVESLINHLIDENERFHKVDFIVVSVSTKEAEKISQKYQYTEFVYIKPYHKIWGILDLLRRVIRKIIKCDITSLNRYYANVEKKLRDKKADYYVMEGGIATCLYKFTKKIGIEKCYFHLHAHAKYVEGIDKIFGRFIFVSEFCKKEFDPKSELRAYVVKNGIKLDNFNKKLSQNNYKKIRESYGFKETDKVALYCGRLVPEKGVMELISAVIQTEYKLLIVGSGNFKRSKQTRYIKEIQRMSKNYKDKIQFTGYIDNNKLYQIYQISQVVVLPSLCEDAAPLVAVEAQASGRPVIAFQSGGIPEYVSKESALILDKPFVHQKEFKKLQGNNELINEIKEALVGLANNSLLRTSMGRNGREIAENFTTEKFYFSYISLFE